MREDYLQHYGVLGMKWGVRKDPSRAYGRSSKKANKLKKRSNLRESEKSAAEMNLQGESANLNKAKYKAEKAAYKRRKGSLLAPSDYEMENKDRKLAKAQYKYDKAKGELDDATYESMRANQKRDKWIGRMEKEFSKIHISQISDEDLAIGRDYTYMLRKGGE